MSSSAWARRGQHACACARTRNPSRTPPPPLHTQPTLCCVCKTPSVSCSDAVATHCRHAGYSYCGHVMAHAYKHIEAACVSRIFLLGPSHHVYSRQCMLSRAAEFATPLGGRGWAPRHWVGGAGDGHEGRMSAWSAVRPHACATCSERRRSKLCWQRPPPPSTWLAASRPTASMGCLSMQSGLLAHMRPAVAVAAAGPIPIDEQLVEKLRGSGAFDEVDHAADEVRGLAGGGRSRRQLTGTPSPWAVVVPACCTFWGLLVAPRAGHWCPGQTAECAVSGPPAHLDAAG
jgi:hypothetical protein